MKRREAIKRTALLMGGALSASAIAGVMSGCQASGDPMWEPKFLTKEQARMLEEITEIILPATDTPGAKDVHVAEFIDLMLKDSHTKNEQDLFVAGLIDLDKAAQVAFSSPFGKCSADERIQLISAMDKEAFNGSENKFYKMLKSLTLLGYFTSEKVMTTMLDYHSVPQRYDPCVPMTASTRVYEDDNV